ncbi:HAMP domain-containing sensor histidine kinase [Polyangium sp. 15x6]|uniref:sensor histidine kinase n=1 Tax=Polyangium sp. 15x6 TaxID=3042687 RepID=UPI00249C9D34|nr:HAMP domain-containing sensor histidine kinase [Polyangium sp. 15x6]MDI3291228.1 HAMP domain-containing sensor histidine kinase [Polyangium sp. 15x6]
MIDLGTLSIRDSDAVMEARRKVAQVASSLALDPISASCVASGVSEIARRLLAAQAQTDLGAAIRPRPPRSILDLSFTAVSLRAEESGVLELFDSVKRKARKGAAVLVCEKELPIRTQDLTPDFVERLRRLLRRRSRDELMREMRAMNEELTAKNLQLEDFAFSTAHTLKTDWLGVSYLLEELADIMETDGFDHETERHSVMGEIKLRVSRGARTVDELLAYATVGTGVQKKPQSILAVVTNVVDRTANPRLRIDPEFKDAVLPIDEAKFATVLREIINNAIAYGLGSPVDIQCDGKALRIRDRGRGIPGELLVEIFGLFRRAAADSTGSGIGLAIAKQIIAAHGYRISAESEGEGHGSTFVIDFS